jgi:hypothetical protein
LDFKESSAAKNLRLYALAFTRDMIGAFTRLMTGAFTRLMTGAFTRLMTGAFTRLMTGAFTRLMTGAFTRLAMRAETEAVTLGTPCEVVAELATIAFLVAFRPLSRDFF